MTFTALKLAIPLLRAVAEKNYTDPTPIQVAVIPAILGGSDVWASAQTGSGKTAAFALPLLQRLSKSRRPPGRFVRALVLVPTRELAMQVVDQYNALRGTKLSPAALVVGGLAEGNQIKNCRLGVSIGHRDTDNLVVNNDIDASGQSGVLFRPERGPGFCGHRNVIEKNRITNSGGDSGIGIDVQGGTESITLRANAIRETRSPATRIGIRLGKETKDITLAENKIEGVKTDVADLRV